MSGFGYLAKERSIKIAKNMFKAGVDKEEILYYTELIEEEFIKEVVEKVNKYVIRKDSSQIGLSLFVLMNLLNYFTNYWI